MDDLISEFITETTENLATLDSQLVKLEQNPDDTAILSNIFRTMHTIKGTCGFLGLPRLEAVAHAGENVLGKIRDKVFAATPESISMILESIDSIKAIIEHLSANGSEPSGDDKALIAKLNQFAETGTVGGAAAAPAANGVANGAANGAGDNPFPHFCGEDDPEIKAALEKIMVLQGNTAPAALVESKVEMPAAVPVAEAPKPVAKPQEKAPAAAEHKESKDAGAANQSIRVNLDVLENLMQMVSELVLTRNQLMQIVRTKEDKDFMSPLQQLSHITTELQDGIMKTRMQPIGNAWSKFPRLIRDLSRDLNKKIDLQMVGEETELDRQLLEVIKDPLTHMVRNSCDHGLETPAERLAAGKPETGTVTLSAYHEGGHIIIDIEDDGRGIPIDKVKKKALANGLATEAQLEAMSEKQIAQFIFAAGFSTAEKVTAVSGRGVGMDVVRTNIESIGGTIDLDSSWGKGSKVAIKIPLTLAIVSVLLVQARGQKFAIPQINVVELVRVSPKSALSIETINDALVLRLRGKLLPLTVLSEVLGHKANHKELMQKEAYIAVCKVGDADFGVLVDHVYDTEEIVVKPVASILKDIPVYAGNTILGDGSVIMILDLNGIAKSLGNMQMVDQKQIAAEKAALANVENLVSFLLFSTGKGAPKSVPLELISRLEEIDVSTIEVAGDHPVVQYRGELMRLMTLDPDFKMPDSGKVEVIVFSYDKKVIGLVVQEIIDIVHAPFDIKLTTQENKEHGYLGSMVVNGKTTDVLDVNYVLADLVEQAIAENKANKHIADSKVLLVEDSPFFRNLTLPFLTAAGYKVTPAENGQQALEIIEKNGIKFDVIVTDLEMPVMDGFAFADACRHSARVNGTPIIAYTSVVSDETLKHSKQVGMNDCIVKTDRPGLLQSMSHWLSQPHGGRGVAA